MRGLFAEEHALGPLHLRAVVLAPPASVSLRQLQCPAPRAAGLRLDRNAGFR
jgi:hypothetical protein